MLYCHVEPSVHFAALRTKACNTARPRKRSICVATAPLQRPAHRRHTDEVVTVREPCSNAELEEAAQIRADCFYEVGISHILRASAVHVNGFKMLQATGSQI